MSPDKESSQGQVSHSKKGKHPEGGTQMQTLLWQLLFFGSEAVNAWIA